MKRVISIILVLCLLPVALAVPALAAEAAPVSVYDLLSAVEYTITDNNGKSSVSSWPSVYATNASYVDFVWDPSAAYKLERVYIGIKCAIRPSDVQVYHSGSFVSCTYSSSADGVHYYTYDSTVLSFSVYKVRVHFDSAVKATLAITSFYGFVDNAVDVSIVNYFTNIIIGHPDLAYREVVGGDSGSAMLPVASEWYGPYEYDEPEEMLYAECFYKAASPLDFAQSASFLVYTVGELQNVGVRLETSSGNIIAGLNSSVEACGDSQIVVEFQEEMYRCKVYVITVDLAGYDLADYVVTLSYEVLPVHSSGFLEFSYGYYSQLTAASFLPMEEEPNIISRFTAWLRGQFDQLNSSISTWGQNIVDAINPPKADSSAGDTLVQQGQQIHDFEQQHQEVLSGSVSTLQQFSNISGFSASLSFVSGYVSSAFGALGDFQVVITLPLVIGLIFFLASRVRGFDKPRKHNAVTDHTKQITPKTGGTEAV